ncbi:unnamed protein product [Ceutorhynchus assimilis]|uniref:MADF domain-containing protein n=1 Tax=Ceutorhynchus assimilis TaxID=467358 RepID=A0A9N9QLL4_9CUCU|nr:unnamed protein product [Ceutorhynchus assimilis]
MDDADLIEQVGRFSALYNKGDARFKNKGAKENAWKTIGAILGQRPQVCEQRWVVLRNRYTKIKREITTMPSGSGAFHNNWPHFHSMGFLDPYLTTRKTTSNYPIASESQSQWEEESQTSMTDATEVSMLTEEESSCRSKEPRVWDSMAVIIDGGEDSEQSQLESQSLLQQGNRVTPKIGTERLRTAESTSEPDDDQSGPSKKKLSIRKSIPRSIPIKRQATAQETALAKMGNCFDIFQKKMTSSEPHEHDESMAFAISLANDMKILTTEEKILCI